MSLIALALLIGCDNLGRNRPGDEPVDDSGLELLAVDAVQPSYLTTLGGQVEILGGPFDGSAQVTLDAVEATVLSAEEDRLLVEVPALSAGWVDVQVQTDFGQGELERGLQVFEDATGLAGSLGAIEWYELQGSYWTNDSQDFGTAWFGLIEPEEVHWWDIFGVEIDDCTADPSFPSLKLWDLGASEVTLAADGVELELQGASDRIYDAALSSQQYLDWADYSLQTVVGSELPEFGIERVGATPGSFQLFTPAVYSDAPPVLRKNELTFDWGEVEAERVIVMAERRSGEDVEEILETVACVAENDGSFQIPGSTWQQGWDSDDWLYLYVGAVREDGGTIPLNNADSRVAGVYWLLGAATTSK